jgi:hypothetical protein
VRGDGVRHLDGCLPPDRLLQAAWDEVVAAAPDRFAGVGLTEGNSRDRRRV